MNQIILATHGGLANGMRDTLSMVLGDASNVHVVSLARDDKDPITSKVQALIDSFDPADKVYVCTDMLAAASTTRWSRSVRQTRSSPSSPA